MPAAASAKVSGKIPAIRPGATLDGRQLLGALRAFRRGDFSVRLPRDLDGMDGDIAEAFNDVVELNDRMTREFDRLGEVVGKQGKITHRAKLPGAAGSWADSVEAVNSLITDTVHPTAEMARVIGAVARGDLGQTMDLENQDRPLRGEFLRIGRVVNTMVGQLGSFASEVTRVAREVGTEGKLGGQAKVKGVTGAWKDLTDNVNLMAASALHILKEQREKRFGLHIPIQIRTLNSIPGRQAVLARLRSSVVPTSEALVVCLQGLDAGVPRMVLETAVSALRPACLGVVARAPSLCTDVSAWRGARLSAVSFDFNDAPPGDDAELSQALSRFAANAAGVGSTLIGHSLTSRARVIAAWAAGFTHLSGDVLEQRAALPFTPVRFEAASLYDAHPA